MKSNQALQTLRTFNERVRELSGTSFSRTVLFQETGFAMDCKPGEPVSVQRHGPDEESIKAFVLTFRLIIGRNEMCSLEKLKRAYSSALVSRELIDGFCAAIGGLDDYLASQTSPSIGPGPVTYGDILETFLWGNLAHANNPAHKQRHDTWKSYGDFFEIFRNQLVAVLGNYMRYLIHLHDLNVQMIRALGHEP